MDLIETLGMTTVIIIIAVIWLGPLILASRHLAKIKRPTLMKLLWFFSFIVFGIFSVLIYFYVVYFPEKRKEKQNETNE